MHNRKFIYINNYSSAVVGRTCIAMVKNINTVSTAYYTPLIVICDVEINDKISWKTLNTTSNCSCWVIKMVYTIQPALSDVFAM